MGQCKKGIALFVRLINPARIRELREINEFMENFDENIQVLWGHYPDQDLEDEIKVTIMASTEPLPRL